VTRARVVLTTNALTIGGTEKGLVNHALELDPDRFDVHVVTAVELGPRADALAAGGVPVECAHGDESRLTHLLRGADVVHVFRAGAAEPVLLRAGAQAGAGALVETNVFGLVDPSPRARDWDCQLFLSQMCALRYRWSTRADASGFHDRHRVLRLPLDVDRLPELSPPPAEAKAGLGLDPARPVVGRIGRADDLKWRSLLLDMLAVVLTRAPHAQVLLVGTTHAVERQLRRRGLLDRCLLHPEVTEEKELSRLYAACDVFVSAAQNGESQGLAIAEAMSLGRPVVTCSTPWVDNGQLELVEHGETGYVANHARPFGEAVLALLEDESLRTRLGSAGRAKVARTLDVRPLTRQLERLYEALLAGAPAPDRWDPSPAEVDAFAQEYEDRLRREFRPLDRRERVEARLLRERERAVRVRGLLKRERLPLAAAMVKTRIAPGRWSR
jgi:glycosyltransferase involved in cell wall biosynthesis